MAQAYGHQLLDLSLRVVRLADSAPGGETLSFEEAADFNPQE
jgi:hypothetical protein